MLIQILITKIRMRMQPLRNNTTTKTHNDTNTKTNTHTNVNANTCYKNTVANTNTYYNEIIQILKLPRFKKPDPDCLTRMSN